MSFSELVSEEQRRNLANRAVAAQESAAAASWAATVLHTDRKYGELLLKGNCLAEQLDFTDVLWS
jgi:hypothetical protein